MSIGVCGRLCIATCVRGEEFMCCAEEPGARDLWDFGGN